MTSLKLERIRPAAASGRPDVAAARDLAELLRHDDARPGLDLLVWQDALRSRPLRHLLSGATWPLEVLAAFPPRDLWTWSAYAAEDEPIAFEQLPDQLRSAAGVDGPPRGNVRATLQIRPYGVTDSQLGDLQWWRQVGRPAMAPGFPGAALGEAIVEALAEAAACGLRLFTEEICLVVSKDPEARLSSITPTLHSDSYYGARETAITTLPETGWDRLEGAVFAPGARMSELWPLRPIDLPKLVNELEGVDLVGAGSGDILIYDGMKDAAGVAEPARGIPHISPDWPGLSSRLAILMTARRDPR